MYMLQNNHFLFKFAASPKQPNIVKTKPVLNQQPEWITRGVNNLKSFEGWRSKPYLDTKKNQSIGYGFNLNDKNIARRLKNLGYISGQPLSKAVGDKAISGLVNDTYIPALQKMYPKFNKYPDNTKEALLNMIYNLGEPKLTGFKKMRDALEAGDYNKASLEAVDSNWAKQVKSRRANYVKNLIASGAQPLKK